MIGAIAGDFIGSAYEFNSIKSTEFPLFSANSTCTDDSILTIAVADCLLNRKEYAPTLKEYGRNYPYGGYGEMFLSWLASDNYEPYNSYGNGSAMRVSPIGFAFNSLEQTLTEAKRSAEVTHNHPEGIKGAQAVASAIYLARNGKSKGDIQKYVEGTFNYDLHQKLDEIRPDYDFDETCQGSVPQSIIAFLESENYEDAVRKAVSLGGDADTMACIAGGIAEAFYGDVPKHIISVIRDVLDADLIDIIDSFYTRFIPGRE
ncbi:ADP-ribosylglycohydrolase family protein [Chloroflexota bacterium]